MNKLSSSFTECELNGVANINERRSPGGGGVKNLNSRFYSVEILQAHL